MDLSTDVLEAWDEGYDLGYAECATDLSRVLFDLREGLQGLPNSRPFVHVLEALSEEYLQRALHYQRKHEVHLKLVKDQP